ncbi:enoyl-CoA hydratase-related protein [Paraburkholderia sediminicola]|uniref:Enoyl-CoA hydratase-related protein n=1 Tax=Paraburkholderia rhynchosiae TaxID=487049 RepID=A0ACC7NM65_9BURK
MTKYEMIEVEDVGSVKVAKLNRPQAANAINTQLGCELLDVFADLAVPRDTRCVILSAAGERHFCAGGDLKERNGMTDDQYLKQHAVYERMVRAIVECPIPVIAAVNGIAYAGGTELVLACDFAYAVPHARFALTETSLGIMPGCGGTQNLPRAIGMRRAKELILSATPFSAEEALQWGMLNKIVSGSVMDEAMATATKIASNGPLAITQAKRAMNFGAQMDLRSAMEFEIDAYNRLATSNDRKEGIAAFNENRAPQWTGN